MNVDSAWYKYKASRLQDNSILLSISELLSNPEPLRSIVTVDYKSTMAANPVVLILGAGPRIGASVAEKFASNGYKVAVASRSGSGIKTANGFLSLKADFTKPDSIPALFDAVKTEFHTSPSVVVYNAAALTNPPHKDSFFRFSGECRVGSECQHYQPLRRSAAGC
jgi:hypothetical protein